jgi:hypothetical protein
MIKGSVVKITHLAAALAVLCLVSGLTSGTAEATSMVRLGLSELTYISDLIAFAEVEESAPEKAPGSIYIKTVSTLRLTRVIKGELIEGDRIYVREWGGKLGGEQTHLPGAPRYVAGERVMVFLERERLGSMWRTVGLSQGKMTLIEEPDTGRDVTLRVQVPALLDRFDESQVQLPAVRSYSEDVVARVRDDLSLSFVPPYQSIPGLPPAKDRLFFEAALASGQQLDPRWPQFQAREER